jgi:hypothetical protein
VLHVARSSSVATGASRDISGSVSRRPADCFESFGVIPKELESHDLPLANCVDAGHFDVRVRAVTLATPYESRDYAVTAVGGLTNRLRCVGAPGLAQLLGFPQDRLATDVRPRLRPPSGGRQITSESRKLPHAVMSPAVHASKEAWTICTFACDITEPLSGAGERAKSGHNASPFASKGAAQC